MSFVQRLRMANMFPVRSGLGDAQIDMGGPNPMDEVIEAGKSLALFNRDVLNRQQTGLRSVGNMGRQTNPSMNQPMNVRIGEQSNPGADILNRSAQSAERIYQGYNEPQVQAKQMGPSNDEIAAKTYFDRKNAETDIDLNRRVKESQITNNNRRVDVAENNSEGNLADKQAKLKLAEDAATNKVATEQGKLDTTNALKTAQRKAIKDKAQIALDELNQIIDEKTGKLNTRGQSSVGADRLYKHLPWPTQSYEGNKSIDRLKSLLTLDLIGEMKAQSRTGATGFGNMNIREFGALETGASKMDSKLGEENFETQAATVRKHLNDILTDSPEINPVSSHDSVISKDNAPQSTNPNYEAVRRTDNKGWTFQKKVSK